MAQADAQGRSSSVIDRLIVPTARLCIQHLPYMSSTVVVRGEEINSQLLGSGPETKAVASGGVSWVNASYSMSCKQKMRNVWINAMNAAR